MAIPISPNEKGLYTLKLKSGPRVASLSLPGGQDKNISSIFSYFPVGSLTFPQIFLIFPLGVSVTCMPDAIFSGAFSSSFRVAQFGKALLRDRLKMIIAFILLFPFLVFNQYISCYTVS